MAVDIVELQLLVPADDEGRPELSIVVPAADEEQTISEFVRWCKEGLRDGGIRGEILIVDSSTDRTAELALEGGARVLKTPRRGLGRAYIDALPYIRGRYVLMGDADCTYDFRRLLPFVEKLREGNEFVMGSRFKGTIEPHSMPWLHRYFGTPITTWILNLLYGSRFSDIHCGMRAISTAALRRMGLRSQSWEYASEMVLRSVHMRLKTVEVPVRFLSDPPGRVSHHKREGWLSPWKAAWINVRAMFVYGVDFFTVKPGIALTAIGLATVLPLAGGPVSIGSVTLSLYSMFIGVACAAIGFVSLMIGLSARALYDDSGQTQRRLVRVFPYTRTVLVSTILFVTGFSLVVLLVVKYAEDQRNVVEGAAINHLAVLGLLLMIVGFVSFVFMLFFQAIGTRWERPYEDIAPPGDASARESRPGRKVITTP